MREKLGLRDETVADEVVLVTGAEGCIGAWAVRNLALAGVKVVSTDLAPFGLRLGKILDLDDHPDIAYEQADLRHPDVLPKLIQHLLHARVDGS